MTFLFVTSSLQLQLQSRPMMCSPLGSLQLLDKEYPGHDGPHRCSRKEPNRNSSLVYCDSKLLKACSLCCTCSWMCLRMCKLFPKHFAAFVLNSTQNVIRTCLVDAVTASQREKGMFGQLCNQQK